MIFSGNVGGRGRYSAGELVRIVEVEGQGGLFGVRAPIRLGRCRGCHVDALPSRSSKGVIGVEVGRLGEPVDEELEAEGSAEEEGEE